MPPHGGAVDTLRLVPRNIAPRVESALENFAVGLPIGVASGDAHLSAPQVRHAAFLGCTAWVGRRAYVEWPLSTGGQVAQYRYVATTQEQ